MIYSSRLFLRLESFIWYCFLALFPLQVRVILWQADWVFNEWRSMALYGTDLFFVFMIFGWLVTGLRGIREFKPARPDVFLSVFFVIVCVSILQYQENAGLGVYHVLRLVQAVGLYYYIRLYAINRFSPGDMLLAFTAGGVLQAGIGFSQFLLQHDFGLRWLGETVLGPDMRGVAVFHNFSGHKIMRAYGTFPHPNVLAAYLLASFLALHLLYQREKNNKIVAYCLLPTAYCLFLFAFYATFARTTIFVFIALFILSIYLNSRKKQAWAQWRGVVVTTLVVTVIFLVFFWQEALARLLISSQEEAVQLRLFFNREAISSGSGLGINWLGVGFGNFVSWFIEAHPGLNPYLYQPVHNIYLLIYSEVGVFGLVAFMGFLINLFLKKSQATGHRLEVVLLVTSFLFIAFFDHFWLTLQQGRLLLFGILALL